VSGICDCVDRCEFMWSGQGIGLVEMRIKVLVDTAWPCAAAVAVQYWLAYAECQNWLELPSSKNY
jgi:hypothetical protein